MKVTIFPQKSDVLAVIQDKIDRERANQEKDQKELDTLMDGTVKIIRPGQKEALTHLVGQRKEFLDQMEGRKKLIESDVGTSVQVELEL